MSWFIPKPDKVTPPPPPPNAPTRADASVPEMPKYQSLVSSGSAGGLKRKANTVKRSLIGG